MCRNRYGDCNRTFARERGSTWRTQRRDEANRRQVCGQWIGMQDDPSSVRPFPAPWQQDRWFWWFFPKKRGKQLQLFLLSSRLLKEFSCTSSWMDDRFGKYLRCKTRYPLQGTSFRQTVHWLIPTCFARTTCGHTLGVGPLHHSSQATWTKTVKHVVFVCLRPIGPMFTLYVVL